MKFKKLTGLRGFAALVVFISHAGNAGYLPHALGHGLGQVGVMIFFVLSGFLMSYLYLDKPFDKESVRSYMFARVGRVVPLYFAVIFASIAISKFYPAFRYNFASITDIITSILFIQAPFELWTIPVEMQFYVVFVALWWLTNRQATPKIILLFVLAVMVPTAFLIPAYGKVPNIVSSYAFAFFLGTITSHLYKNGKLHIIPEKALNIFGPITFIAVFINLPDLRREVGLTLSNSAYALTWLDPITWLIVYTLFLCTLLNTHSLRILESRACLFLGEISYGFYLIHRPILEWMKDIVAHPAVGLALSFIITVALSCASFYLFERKAATLIRRWSR